MLEQPANIIWDFRSLKSNIKNFNETTSSTFPSTKPYGLRESNSSLIAYRPLSSNSPLWIYPYTYLNRHFDHILRDVLYRIEQANRPSSDTVTEINELQQIPKYPYQLVNWSQISTSRQKIIQLLIKQINRLFNIDPPIVGLRISPIYFYTVSSDHVIYLLNLFKRYTLPDIQYCEDFNPNANRHLSYAFDRTIIVDIDSIERSHFRYLRLMATNREPELIGQLSYAQEYDQKFYLTRSGDLDVTMPSNAEARQMYINHLQTQKVRSESKCFHPYQFIQQKLPRVDDPVSCEMASGIWERQCQTDQDCPLFQANRNYRNNFGGCNRQTGFCQWPSGVTSATYRQPKNLDQALCYNCQHGFLGPGTLGQCCHQQKNPDYQYPNDLSARYNARQQLQNSGLNWSKYLDSKKYVPNI